MKVTIIDAVSAWVMEQQIYDAQGRLRARSVAEGYRRDPRTDCMFPRPCRWSVPRRSSRCASTSARCKSTSCRAIRPSCGPCPAIPVRRRSNLGNPNLPYGPPPGMSAGR